MKITVTPVCGRAGAFDVLFGGGALMYLSRLFGHATNSSIHETWLFMNIGTHMAYIRRPTVNLSVVIYALGHLTLLILTFSLCELINYL